MKPSLIRILVLASCTLFSCQETTTTDAKDNQTVAFLAFQKNEALEKETTQFIRNYIAEGAQSNWKSQGQYLNNPELFIEEHTAFRTSFPDFRSKIKHLKVEGNSGIVWLSCSGTFSAPYTHEGSAYGDEILKTAEVNNQKVIWEETWFFTVVNGKFTDDGDYLKDHHAVLQALWGKVTM